MTDRDRAGCPPNRGDIEPNAELADSIHETTVEFAYESPVVADIVAESVGREVGEIDDDRSRTTLSREGATVSVRIDARDLTALRAAANTWFSLVDVAERTARLGPAGDPGPDAAGSDAAGSGASRRQE